MTAVKAIVGSVIGLAGEELDDLEGATRQVRQRRLFGAFPPRCEFDAMARRQVRRSAEKRLENKGLGGSLNGFFT